MGIINLKKQTLLVVAPHPDDEILGCGGLIKRVKDEGGKVYVLYMTVGDTDEFSENGSSSIHERMKEIEKVAKYMNFDGYRVAFPGNSYHLRLDSLSQKDIMYQIESGNDISLDGICPTMVATPYLHDYNQDHRTATQAVLAATRPIPSDLRKSQPLVLGFECVPTADWWTNPRSINVYVSLTTRDLKCKMHALSMYASQVRSKYHVRSLRSMQNLSYYRGMQIGVRSAEGFYCYRQII